MGLIITLIVSKAHGVYYAMGAKEIMYSANTFSPLVHSIDQDVNAILEREC